MSHFYNIDVGKMKLGSVGIAKAYLGSTLVFQNGSGPTPTPGRLPSGYTELEYISNGSNAWIDTGISGVAAWTVSAKIDASRSASQVIIGRGTSTPIWFGAYTNKTVWGMGSSQNSSTSALNKTTSVVSFSGKTASAVVGTNDSCSRTFSANGTGNYTLFNVGTNKAYPFVGNLYGDVICVQNNVETFHGVPCTDPNNVAGLYDLISDTFFGSANATPLTAGPAIPI